MEDSVTLYQETFEITEGATGDLHEDGFSRSACAQQNKLVVGRPLGLMRTGHLANGVSRLSLILRLP